MDLIIVGMGRAGGSLARAALEAGHRLAGVLSRRPPALVPVLDWDSALPPCDLVLLAVSDGAIGEVAARLAPYWSGTTPAVHLSGFVSVDALEPVTAVGASVGSFHPLQTLPDPERGAAALAGSWAAVTAEDPELAALLEAFAASLGMQPFPLDDDAKPVYHAAAAAAANYVVEALAVAADLATAAGVDAAVMEPLTRRVVENVFEVGAEAALTGPIARGDLATVAGQQRAADAASPELGAQFRLLAEATALRAGVEL
jgi:predicted short-subunit dehydrogenase-like oxidoreductase (DUF2520 family)